MSEKPHREDISPISEFRIKKQGISPVLSSEKVGFQAFELAQKKSKDGTSIESYSFDKSDVSPIDKQAALVIEIEQYLTDMHV